VNAATAGAVSVALVTACGGQPAHRGVGEPVLVEGQQFITGNLPGMPPTSTGSVTDGGPPVTVPLSITNVTFQNQLVLRGAAAKSFSGRATDDAVAIGVRFADMGTGYWVVPIAEADPQFPGQRTFQFAADFDVHDPPGSHALRFVGIGGDGRAGIQSDTPLCIESPIPDNLHACDPTRPVPAAVFVLAWDADFDLDLHVVTPAGRDVGPKGQTAVPIDAGAQPAKDVARIDRDSLALCVPDGLRQEDFVMQSYPPRGKYAIYADPFDPCGKPAVRFKLTIYEGQADGQLHATYEKSGELLASQVTGGGSTGLFIAEKQFN
jgi:hypothetical protein